MASHTLPPSREHAAPVGRALVALALSAMGVVFGDLGTSPLYALRDTFVGSHAIAATRENVLGVLSLFVWSLVLVVCVKYLAVIMRADNRGEGGILALLALTEATRPDANGRMGRALVLLGIAGAALLYGDGVITPAISVLSAIEGLTVATTAFTPYVVPITVGVLIGLFAVQSRGSARIGRVFGPVLGFWFVVIGLLGAVATARTATVLAALDPRWGVRFFAAHGWHGIPTLGAVVLCLTGGEALYADMGHFGKRPIRVAWFGLAFPCLVLSYLGQGATLLADPSAAEHPFLRSVPTWTVYPLVALATAATVIASQALISAVFSLTRQAVQLGLAPRVQVVHTSSREIGQIYLPGLNWALMACCLALVLGFRSSTALAAAFGLAVSGTMAITTLLFAAVARRRWRWSRARVMLVAGTFLLVDLAFLVANLLKIPDGGWIPLVLGGVVFLLMATWRRGRALLAQAVGAKAGSDADILPVLASVAMSVEHGSCARVHGTAVYLHGVPNGLPRAFVHNLKNNRVLHRRVVFLTVLTEEVPSVADAERVTVASLAAEDAGEGFWRVVARYGFMEQPDVPHVLRLAEGASLPFRPAETNYFLGRETILPADRPGMARWRERLYGAMHRNALPATAFFGLPPNRVMELGAQVEI